MVDLFQSLAIVVLGVTNVLNGLTLLQLKNAQRV